MQLLTNKDKGRAGMALAIAYFGSNGYTVSIPLNDTQWYDLIVEKDGHFQTVQCKFTASETKAINLKSAGGTKGTVYDSVLDHPVDLLFCADDEQNLFVIPVKDIIEAGNTKVIHLRTSLAPTANVKFDTTSYLVQI